MRFFRQIQTFYDNIIDSFSDKDSKLQGFSYYAFISYTEKDEKWAEWLQWNLEHYRIPTKVRSENKELPKRVRPVFWYKNDLAGAHLSGAIKRELEESKYMIVICSPTSAKKEWVNEEVRYFKDILGRGSQIIPFVIEGEINTDNEELESLPLPIRRLPRNQELRCIDVREYGKNKALVNIVSTLFNIRFDVLWNRFQREQRRRFIIYGLFLALLSVSLWGYWDYYLHTTYEYYVDVEDCYGIPTGIIQIDNEEAHKYWRLYRFEYCQRKLQRVVYVDGKGNPQEHTNSEMLERVSIQELSYSNDELTSIICKASTSETLYVKLLSKDKDRLAVDLKDEDENQAANFIYSSTSVDQGMSDLQQSSLLDKFFQSPSKIARYIYQRDADGYIIRKQYARHNGDDDEISMDANGISGFEYERDSLHRIVRIRFLDEFGNYKSNNRGIAGKKYQYDKNGNLWIAEYLDKDGNLQYNEEHWAKAVDIYDGYGLCVEECVFGADGYPCVSARGYHKVCFSISGNTETVSLFDISNNPAYAQPYGQEPGGYSIMRRICNSKGQCVSIYFMNADSTLCYNQHHVAIMKIEYNEEGLITGVRNYDVDENPCINTGGWFYMKSLFNKEGKLLEESYFNPENKPVQDHRGVHCFRMKYDNSNRRLTEVHVYNVEGLPISCPDFNGAAWVRLGYIGNSPRVSDIYFFNEENKPFETVLGVRVRGERNHQYGHIEAFKYYNENNELYANSYHSAMMKLTYNEFGRVETRSYYDENERPTMYSGFFQMRFSYTTTGLLEEVCVYDTLLRYCLNEEGWAVQRFTYKNGLYATKSFYGINREAVDINGVSKDVYERDEAGYIISESVFDKDNNPAESLIGAHKVVFLYDDNRRNVERVYFDTKNKSPFVRIRFKYNSRGFVIEQTAHNSQNEPVESSLNYGVAKLNSDYDSQDLLLYMCATDVNGAKMNSTMGFAEAYFIRENTIQEAVYLDAQGNIVNNKLVEKPYAYYIMYISDSGQRLYHKTVRLSYDEKKETIREVYCYDKAGTQVERFIQCEDDKVGIVDFVNAKKYQFYSFEDKYKEYVHIVDSIQYEIELKYGKPSLIQYVNRD